MAQKTQTILIDDIDGSPASGTVRFALDGVEYDIDLSEAHARKLRDSFEPWTSAARRTGGRRSAARGSGTTAKAT